MQSMPAAKEIKYHKYADGAHGWLKVTKTELRKLNLLDRISSYSFVTGNYVFLEEDTDMSLFINAWEERVGCQFPPIVLHQTDNDSYIRNYEHYQKEVQYGIL